MRDGTDDTVEHITQVAALGAHPAGGTDFLVVEHRPHRGAGAVAVGCGIQKGQQRGSSTFQVINARGEEILAVRAQPRGLLARHQLQITVQDILGLHAQFLTQHIGQAAAAHRAPQRLHIDLGVEFLAFVDIALHVDGQ